ncbi:MAG: exported protein of unknown function [Verrucomicrobiales bacterium]|nr:exported protein of unknown function [Verrucomicrobiales bacterium]
MIPAFRFTAFLCASLFLVSFGAKGQTNGVFRELYGDIPGTSVANLTNAASFPKNPTAEFLDGNFEAPRNFNDNYGQRMRAFLLPPATGLYKFWISSDDNSVLYVSSDENPANKVLIASVKTYTPPEIWDVEVNQESVSISLTNGFRYYIEALHKEGQGSDNLSVRWQLPDGTIEQPIPELRLTPFGLTAPQILAQPQNTAVVEGQVATFSIQFARYIGLSLQWQSAITNGADWIDLENSTNTSLVLPSVAPAASGNLFRCLAINSYGALTSSVATLTVTTDVTSPALRAVGNTGNPQLLTVVFSEPLDPASASTASHYSIDPGISVLAARLVGDGRTVILETSQMSPGVSYNLSVNGVLDRASRPNMVAAGSTLSFVVGELALPPVYLSPLVELAGPSSRRSPIAITEINYHPAPRIDGRNIEFVEIYNSQPYFADIGGYQLTGTIDFKFPANTVLPGLGYLVIGPNPGDIQAVYGITNVIGGFTNKLSNGGGAIQLLNRQNAILLDVNYGSTPPWPVAADGAGHSLALKRPSLGEQNPLAWGQSDLIGGSPGGADLPGTNPFAGLLINEFMAHTVPPQVDFVELYNYNSQPLDISGCILTDDPAINKFIVPANSGQVGPLGFISFDQNQLGFALSAAGETIYLKNPEGNRVLDVVRFDAQGPGVSMGRSPDGAPRFQRLEAVTPGARNAAPLRSEVVINEIMYAPISGDNDDQYVELYNRGTNRIDVGGWKFTAGIDFTIPAGTALTAGGYLVIAKNASQIISNYSNLSRANTLGDFRGSLSHGGERIALSVPETLLTTNSVGQISVNKVYVDVDEATYGIGGRWGNWSHGGGSSLELIEPGADKNFASNWKDSDESAKSGWATVEASGVLDNGNDAANSLQIITLGTGEYLVDEVQVIPAGGINVVTNSSFENGLGGWFAQGNHSRSSLETGAGYNSSRSLHVRASSHGDTGANRIRTKLSKTLASGQTVTIRAHVKWLHGHPEILFRLHGNWFEATGNVLRARNLGTPGLPNSAVVANAGPAISDVRHSPLLPAANQSVTVTARVSDPDELSSVVLKYRMDPSSEVTILPMQNNGAGLFSAVIPGAGTAALAAFRIEAHDDAELPERSLFPADAPVHECLIRWGEPVATGSFGVYHFWMTKAVFDLWSKREHLSNEPLDVTFVYGNRVIYNAAGEYSGSPYHAPGFNTPTGNVCDYLLTFPDDDLLMGESEITLQWPGNGGGDNSYQREQTAYWIGEQIGIPSCYRRTVKVYVNGVRRAQLMEDVQQPNGGMVDEFFPDGAGGDLHKIQLWFEFDDPAVSFTPVGADLGKYNTTGGVKKLARYRWNWPKRAVNGSANDYTNFFALVDTANTRSTGDAYTRELTRMVDVDNWMRTYAVEHIVGNNDSYAYGGGQNMYAYQPLNDRWKLMIWDIDFAFASASATSDLFQGGGANTGPSVTHPPFRRIYWQALQDAATGPLSAARANPLIDAKYAAFTSNGSTVESPSSIKTYIAQRQTYILKQLTNINSPFVITSNAGNDFSTNRSSITLAGKAPIDVRVILLNGVQYPITWISITNWNVTVGLQPGPNRFTFQGLDKTGASTSNRIASIQVTYTGTDSSTPLNVFINEWMADNGSGSDWFELYNAGTATADLSNCYLTDTVTNQTLFSIPSGYKIAPQGFLLVWADGQPALNSAADTALHVPFQLNKGGEAIGLYSTNGVKINTLVFGPQKSRVSEGRWPDGGTAFYFMTNATPRLPNRLDSTNATEVTQSMISGQSFTLQFSTYPGKHYRVETTEDIGSKQWSVLGTDFIASDRATATVDVIAGINQRFYRIVRID